MNKYKNTDPVIVIIATSFARTDLLLERSLKSVYEQTNINPHQIYIVDDNPRKEGELFSEEHANIKKVIKRLQKEILKPKFEHFKQQRQIYNLEFDNFFHTTLIQNTRTKGYSGTGAWNTAAFKALRYSGRNYFLAFLDDDDEWEKEYLETLYESVRKPKERKIKGRTKIIKTIASVAGFLRIENKKEIEIQANKETFTKETFFVKNAGLQGSNLFIEQKTFWRIGGFDESLKSATDRDFAIRLIEYENIRPSKEIKFIDKILVKHYAISEKRVTSNPENKKQGLDTFYRKYLHQFSDELKEKSLARAKKLFDYNLNDKIQVEKLKVNLKSILKPKETTIPFNLIIGAISDNAENLTELFKSFLNLYEKHGNLLKDYVFLILENSDNEFKIRPIINYFVSSKKLKIELIHNLSHGRTISENRTLLQKKVYEKGEKLFNNKYVAWIIDDDHLFKLNTINKNGVTNYFKIISEQSNNGIDAMFGLVYDAPPLPFLSTLRSQLIDFYYNLTYFANCKPNEPFILNNLQQSEIEREEFYYDLSNNNFQHLEYPYYWKSERQTNLKAFENFLTETALLSNGVNVFRKLNYAPETIGNVTKKTIYRGGNTIIFNPDLLKTPNYTPEKEYNRRSDFNWSIINKHIFKRELYEIILPLKHDRQLQKMSLVTNEHKLHADIKGLIFYRVFDNILSRENWDVKKDFKNEMRFYNQVKRDTFFKIKVNNYRILSLTNLILYKLKNVKLWWFNNEYRKEINYIVQQNIYVMEVLRVELGKRKFQVFLQNLEQNMKMDNDFINKVITEMKIIKQRNGLK